MEHAYPRDGGPAMSANQVDDTVQNPILDNPAVSCFGKAATNIFVEHDGSYVGGLFRFYSFFGLYTGPLGTPIIEG